MKVVVLAAGISTRLRPLTNTIPKPMLPVAGRPIMEYVVRQVAASGICDELIITTHYLPEPIRAHFGDGSRFGVPIHYAHEDVLMNTAGSLKQIEHLLADDDFMVIGGNDYLPDIDLRALCESHDDNKKRGGIGTIAFVHVHDPVSFGQGIFDDHGKLMVFREKASPPFSTLVHSTYQIYAPRALSFIPTGVSASIPEYLIFQLMEAGEQIYGYMAPGDFVCVSTQERYAQAQLQLATKE